MPSTISAALTTVVPDAKVSSDPTNKMLIVTASEEDHKRIQAVLEQADKRGGGGELVTKAYTLQTANPSTIMTALTPVVPNATISSDPTNQMLVVTASEEDHVRIKAIIDEADRRQDGELTTEVYALKWANPMALSYFHQADCAERRGESRRVQQDAHRDGDGQGPRPHQAGDRSGRQRGGGDLITHGLHAEVGQCEHDFDRADQRRAGCQGQQRPDQQDAHRHRLEGRSHEDPGRPGPGRQTGRRRPRDQGLHAAHGQPLDHHGGPAAGRARCEDQQPM